MSVPSGWTCISPRENSPTGALCHCCSQPARSNIRPSAVTPTNIGERWRSTLAQSLLWMDCHIRRSFCSAPVAFFHVGCLGSPAQPDARMQNQITKDTKGHKDRYCFLIFEIGSIRGLPSTKDNKKGTKN